MAKIPLTRGLFADVDDTDFEWLSRWKWHAAARLHGGFYAARNGRVEDGVRGMRRSVLMHSAIVGATRAQMVDHKDRNSLHNTRANLRICTRSQNAANSPPRLGRRFKGVFFSPAKSMGSFKSEVMADGIIYRLGRFDTEELAAMAYDRKALELFGEFAYLNFGHKTP